MEAPRVNPLVQAIGYCDPAKHLYTPRPLPDLGKSVNGGTEGEKPDAGTSVESPPSSAGLAVADKVVGRAPIPLLAGRLEVLRAISTPGSSASEVFQRRMMGLMIRMQSSQGASPEAQQALEREMAQLTKDYPEFNENLTKQRSEVPTWMPTTGLDSQLLYLGLKDHLQSTEWCVLGEAKHELVPMTDVNSAPLTDASGQPLMVPAAQPTMSPILDEAGNPIILLPSTIFEKYGRVVLKWVSTKYQADTLKSMMDRFVEAGLSAVPPLTAEEAKSADWVALDIPLGNTPQELLLFYQLLPPEISQPWEIVRPGPKPANAEAGAPGSEEVTWTVEGMAKATSIGSRRTLYLRKDRLTQELVELTLANLETAIKTKMLSQFRAFAFVEALSKIKSAFPRETYESIDAMIFAESKRTTYSPPAALVLRLGSKTPTTLWARYLQLKDQVGDPKSSDIPIYDPNNPEATSPFGEQESLGFSDAQNRSVVALQVLRLEMLGERGRIYQMPAERHASEVAVHFRRMTVDVPWTIDGGYGTDATLVRLFNALKADATRLSPGSDKLQLSGKKTTALDNGVVGEYADEVELRARRYDTARADFFGHMAGAGVFVGSILAAGALGALTSLVARRAVQAYRNRVGTNVSDAAAVERHFPAWADGGQIRPGRFSGAYRRAEQFWNERYNHTGRQPLTPALYGSVDWRHCLEAGLGEQRAYDILAAGGFRAFTEPPERTWVGEVPQDIALAQHTEGYRSTYAAEHRHLTPALQDLARRAEAAYAEGHTTAGDLQYDTEERLVVTDLTRLRAAVDYARMSPQRRQLFKTGIGTARTMPEEEVQRRASANGSYREAPTYQLARQIAKQALRTRNELGSRLFADVVREAHDLVANFGRTLSAHGAEISTIPAERWAAILPAAATALAREIAVGGEESGDANGRPGRLEMDETTTRVPRPAHPLEQLAAKEAMQQLGLRALSTTPLPTDAELDRYEVASRLAGTPPPTRAQFDLGDGILDRAQRLYSDNLRVLTSIETFQGGDRSYGTLDGVLNHLRQPAINLARVIADKRPQDALAATSIADPSVKHHELLRQVADSFVQFHVMEAVLEIDGKSALVRQRVAEGARVQLVAVNAALASLYAGNQVDIAQVAADCQRAVTTLKEQLISDNSLLPDFDPKSPSGGSSGGRTMTVRQLPPRTGGTANGGGPGAAGGNGGGANPAARVEDLSARARSASARLALRMTPGALRATRPVEAPSLDPSIAPDIEVASPRPSTTVRVPRPRSTSHRRPGAGEASMRAPRDDAGVVDPMRATTPTARAANQVKPAPIRSRSPIPKGARR